MEHAPNRPSGLKQDHLGLYMDAQQPDGGFTRLSISPSPVTRRVINIYSITDGAVQALRETPDE